VQTLFVMSTDFKTSLNFGLQPITTCTTSIELLQMYLQKFRPRIKENRNDALFISLNGNGIRVGRFVSAFFKRVAGLNITTTTIRAIVATESATLLNTGAITADERDSIQNISGHSGETSKKFYQKRSRMQDMANAADVHSKLLGTPTSDHIVDGVDDRGDDFCPAYYSALELDFANDNDDTPATPSVVTTIGIPNQCSLESVRRRVFFDDPATAAAVSTAGLLHPCPLDSVRRVPWSPKEIAIVGTWCKRFQEKHPGNVNIVAKCLEFIKNDKVQEHFHPHHIQDSARLRWGWQKYQEQQQQESTKALLSHIRHSVDI
jgi:hypothetical protein